MAQTPRRQVSVWLIPSENAGPNDIAQSENIPAALSALGASLAGTHLRLLNIEDPLAMKLRSWNPEFSVPNFQWVVNQKRTIAALERFAQENDVDVVCRLVTWDEAFGLLSANGADGPDSVPDVAQIGTSWAGYFAARHRIMSRPNWQTDRGNWEPVLGLPASALPYTNDVRLLFYWKRLPTASPTSPPFDLNASSWQSILDSLQAHAGVGDTAAFATGITLNLLHDYSTLVWAGPGQSLVSSGILGSSIDLSSSDALAVPQYLATHARIPIGKGEYRRLISFPESSHEEVTRTFVNGGYRVTIEPANFIGRWAQDFEERQNSAGLEGRSRRNFWDYAGVVAPPGGFRGGSELVVSSTTREPALAFRLADFLANDPQYTEMLAEAGHLPSGRPGYGGGELVASLAKSGSENEANNFSLEVQKAIVQGHKYPDLPDWPTVVENRRVLEKLQVVWRCMAQGDVAGMRRAAKDTEWEINSQIYAPVRLKKALLVSWPFFLIAAIVATGYSLWSFALRSRSLRRLIILLHLYRTGRHESVKILGDNLVGMTTGHLACEELSERLSKLAAHYRFKLTPHMSRLSEALVEEVQLSLREQSKRPPTGLDTIVETAREGALAHYQAYTCMKTPEVSFASSGLEEWTLRRHPTMAIVILQEWFFNCLKEIGERAPVVVVSIQGRALSVVSPGSLTDDDIKAVTGSRAKGRIKDDAKGLTLIRDILHYAFETRATVVSAHGRIELQLPFPLERARSAR
jgi:hypothetical protein